MKKMNHEKFIKHPLLPFAEFRFSKNSGRHYKSHMHNSFSIGALGNGEVIYQVEDKSARLKTGGLALINPEKLHCCNPVGDCLRTYYVLYLDVNWCLQIQQSLWGNKTFTPVKNILLEESIIYKKFINTMNTLMDNEFLLDKEQKLADLVENIFLKACKPTNYIEEKSNKIENFKLKLSSNLEDDISIRDIAVALKANPYTLLRQFKSAFGITPHAFRLNCRIEFAKKLLQKGLEISQIALESGFFDQSHFHRHFKTITAVTPGEYQVNFIQ